MVWLGIARAMIRICFAPRFRCLLLLLSFVAASYFPALMSAAVVTLDSIEIFRTHDWFSLKPTVYFQCKDESMTILPDVKEKNVLYAFKGQESWQPLLELQDKKCKRCGFYEEDTIKSDDKYDEWEFCASDFTRSDGKYIHLKEEELNATFLCPDCVSIADDLTSKPNNGSQRTMHLAVILVISIAAVSVSVGGSVIAYNYWQKRKQQQEHARFLRMFEEGDEDLEDELGIGPLSPSVE